MLKDLKNFVPPAHPKGIQLTGRRVSLVPLSPAEHAQSLFAANAADSAGDNWTYLPYGPFDSIDTYQAWLSEQSEQTDPCFFAIVRHADNRAVGLAAFLRINQQDGVIEVGHLNFSPLLQRSREATEAMYLMMEWAFEAGYRRYEWKCNALNLPSRTAAQRLGFSFEGIFRQAAIQRGANRDTAWFAAIDSDWPDLKEVFTTYLADENFDVEGWPKQALSQMTRPLLFKLDTLEFSEKSKGVQQ